MTTYYKAVRPDGTDFYSGKIDYLAGGVISHPNPGRKGGTDAVGYLSVSVSVTDCTGFSWPARLLEVKPVGVVWKPSPTRLPNKRAVKALRVVREMDAPLLFGSQGAEIVALVARTQTISRDEANRMGTARGTAWGTARLAAWCAARDAAWDAARDAAWDAAWGTARDAAWDAAWDTAWGAAWDAAWDTAWGLVSRDLISVTGFTQEHYDLLTGPWRKVVGKIHPDDEEVRV